MPKTIDKVFVLDTNILLTDASNIFKISESGKNLIVLPETVIDEIDLKKTGFDEINFQAREFGRILSEGEIIKTHNYGNASVTSLQIDKTRVDIIALKEYNLDITDKAIFNDRKIIEVAKEARLLYKKYPNPVLLSNDVMCRIRAISLGVETESLSENKDVAEVEFIRNVHDFDAELLPVMQHQPIQKFVSDHKQDNYCYHFHCSNGNEKLAYIVNNRINFITDDLFKGLLIKPLNVGQKFAMAGMLDDRIDICVIEALAGSGKTLLAVAAGIKKVREKEYDKVVYIRNSIESVDKAEEVGFLPGMDSKFMIYNYPLLDTLDFISKKDKIKLDDTTEMDDLEKIRFLQAHYKAETLWNGSLRGRTVSNAYVILDEDQNFSKKSMQTAMSRFDSDCKVICIGSNRQIDNPYINKYTNGLNSILKATKNEDSEVVMFGTELNKVVRGPITEWAEKVFEN